MVTPRSARYPFFEAAREAVEATDVEFGTLIEADAPAVDRAHERVRRALLEGTAESETPDAWSPEDELLSYPIARVLVSLLDSSPAIEKYAAAEAATAIERLQDDLAADDADMRSTPPARIDLETLCSEIGLAGAITPENDGPTHREPDWYHLDVAAYLQFVSREWGPSWRLVNRELSGGAVRVRREELYRLLREAVRRRIAGGLPFEGLSREDPIATALTTQLSDLERLLSRRRGPVTIDFVARELFPPCIENLLQKAEAETELDPFESFTLMAFLTGIGMDAEEIVAFCSTSSLDPDGIRYQTEYLSDDRGTQYPPPSCETLNSYGICHNEDDHWRTAIDPLSYYETRVEAAGEEVVDWRDRRADEPAESH